jgi:hypothetical protein
VEGRAQKNVAGDWTILLARRAPTIKLWSLDARSEGQSSHPLVSEQFAYEWEEGEEDRTSDGANLPVPSTSESGRSINAEEGMEPDDLLCSRNARPQKALVGRAQWKINQPPSLKR